MRLEFPISRGARGGRGNRGSGKTSLPFIAGKESLRRGKCGVVAREGDAVALGEGKQHLGRQRALQVDVLLALGERLQERVDLLVAHFGLFGKLGAGRRQFGQEAEKLNVLCSVEEGNFWKFCNNSLQTAADCPVTDRNTANGRAASRAAVGLSDGGGVVAGRCRSQIWTKVDGA